MTRSPSGSSRLSLKAASCTASSAPGPECGSCFLSTFSAPTIYSGLPWARDAEAGGHEGDGPSCTSSAHTLSHSTRSHPAPSARSAVQPGAKPSRELGLRTLCSRCPCTIHPCPFQGGFEVTGEQGQCLQHLRCSRPPVVTRKLMGRRGGRGPPSPGSWRGRMAGLLTHRSLPWP